MIAPDAEQRMRAALARLDSDAQRAEAAAPGLVSQAWAWAIDAESSASGARELARHARADADRFHARFDALLGDPGATDADAARFVTDADGTYAGGSAGKIVEEAGNLLKPTTAITDVAKASAADLAKAANASLPIVSLAIGVVALYLAMRWHSEGRG